MRILVTPTFQRAVKKLHPSQKQAVDTAVLAIAADPAIGEAKLGDLAGVRVYKFRMNNQLYLLAYTETLKLLALGSHENFSRDLRRS